jgi:F-type H+-transporting ATPase subunit a
VALAGKIDPMRQFMIAPLSGDQLAATPFQFTNSALWMLIVLGVILLFMWGGTRRSLVPGRWQASVEVLTGFMDDITRGSIGPRGRAYLPWVSTAFLFILASNWIGAMPFGIVPAAHPFTVTSQFSVTWTMSVISFLIVLGVGFWRHGLHFFGLFVPKGAPILIQIFIAPVEFISFMVRPFSLGLRPFVAMFAGHILLDVFGNFIVQGLNAASAMGAFVAVLSFIFIVLMSALELLMGAIQAYVFALLTAIYINDAENLH